MGLTPRKGNNTCLTKPRSTPTLSTLRYIETLALFSRFANAYKCNSPQYSPSLADIRNSALSDSTMLVPLWLREESATEIGITYSNKFVLFAACSDDIAFKCLEFVC